MSIKRAFVFMLLALSVFATAQAPNPTVTISAMPKQVQAGAKLTFTVTLSFSEGFHGYQNPPAQDYEIPVVVKIDGKEFKVIKIAYPAGVDAKIGGSDKATKAYEGDVKIPVTVTLPAKVGVKNLKVVVAYQQCDESTCFPPSEVTSTTKVNVVKKVVKS